MDCRNAAKAAAVASPAVTYQEGYHYHRQYRLPAVPLCLDIDYGNCRRRASFGERSGTFPTTKCCRILRIRASFGERSGTFPSTRCCRILRM
ncbi:unnamed protein product [Callosobruchus maculatus]|uniref:Uncharacterized protein n=1 Tax=Callosobruchus maculatus TaxID=64391 RepID=A0A653CJ89_CALMS|nr:unnamed protein product [Callosobruchus maculatus]